jgi:hypothetical protein
MFDLLLFQSHSHRIAPPACRSVSLMTQGGVFILDPDV